MINAGIVTPELDKAQGGEWEGTGLLGGFSILSPLLLNIYMNELDSFVRNMSKNLHEKTLCEATLPRGFRRGVDGGGITL